MLHARALVKLQVLFDLRLAAAFGRLVYGELHVAVAVGHDLGHQRGIFGGDVFVVEVLVELEAHDIGIELNPLIHGVPADVPYHVIDVLKACGPRQLVFGFAAEAGQKRAVVVAAFDKCVNGVAVSSY